MSDATDLIDAGHNLYPGSEFWEDLHGCDERCDLWEHNWDEHWDCSICVKRSK
jgi:hypothetical protein